VSRTLISARKATVAGMLHLGVAMHHPPGPRDTARAHQAGGRALPGEHGDRFQPNMAERGPLLVIRPDSVPRAAFSAAAAALSPDIVGNAAEYDNMGREDGCGRDAEPGSGHASSARPRGHYLGTGSWWMAAPQRDQAPLTI